MKYLLILFFVLFSLTGIALYRVESVIITPFNVFTLLFVIHTFLVKPNQISRLVKYVFVLLFFIILNIIININHISSLNTFLHSIYYLVVYIALLVNLSKITIDVFIRINKIILVVYLISVIVAFLVVSFSIKNEFLNDFFGVTYDHIYLQNRYYGFSSEPSYMAIIISFCFFSLLLVQRKGVEVNGFYKYFIIYLILILFSKSGYGFIYLLLILMYAFADYLKKYRILLPFLFVLSLIIILFATKNTDSRFSKIIDVIFTFDSFENKLELWNLADASSYYRIGPTFWMFDNIDFMSLKTFFGYGMGTDREFFLNFEVGYEGEYLNLGFIPVFIYTNGIIPFVFFMFFVFRLIRKNFSWILLMLFVLILFNCGFATQLFWFVISLLTVMSNIDDLIFFNNNGNNALNESDVYKTSIQQEL